MSNSLIPGEVCQTDDFNSDVVSYSGLASGVNSFIISVHYGLLHSFRH